MSRRPPILREANTVTFPIYLYPFEATTTSPADGGDNIEEVVVDVDGVDIAQREYPADWDMGREDNLWWVSFDDWWLDQLGIRVPSNTTQIELNYLVTAINICIDTKVFFARFVRREFTTIVSDRELIQPSSALDVFEVLERPLPRKITIEGADFTALATNLFDEDLVGGDHSDLNKAIESYRAAVQSFSTEVHLRLMYSVCENALFTGYPSSDEKDSTIAEISDMDQEEAEAWRHLVNRTKHPDEGTSHSWGDTFEDVPPPVEFRMREAANEALRRRILGV